VVKFFVSPVLQAKNTHPVCVCVSVFLSVLSIDTFTPKSPYEFGVSLLEQALHTNTKSEHCQLKWTPKDIVCKAWVKCISLRFSACTCFL
jgi:hypothetical protein